MYTDKEILMAAEQIHEEFAECRDIYEKLCRDVEIQENLENYMEFYSDKFES